MGVLVVLVSIGLATVTVLAESNICPAGQECVEDSAMLQLDQHQVDLRRGSKKKTADGPETIGNMIEKSMVVPFAGPGKRADTVELWAPKASPAEPIPLIIILHGYGRTPKNIMGMLGKKLVMHNSDVFKDTPAILAAPPGRTDTDGKSYWAAWGRACGNCDDSGSVHHRHDSSYKCFEKCNGNATTDTDGDYVLDVVRQIKKSYNVDPARTFIYGYSNGALLTARLMCDHADVFAAGIALAGSAPHPSSHSPRGWTCKPKIPFSMLFTLGTSDWVIPYWGGSGWNSARGSMEMFGKANGCSNTTLAPMADFQSTYKANKVNDTTKYHITGCQDGVEVDLWKMDATHGFYGLNMDYYKDVLSWFMAHSGEKLLKHGQFA